MYAVVKTGGKQYRVAKNDVIKVEKIDGEAGSTVSLDTVLMLNDGKASTVGSPLVEGAVVTAEVLEQGRADKIVVFKKNRRQNYRRTKGHRQHQTVLRVTDILADGKKAAKKATATKAAAKKDDADTAADAPAASEA
ncbi:MAG: 50S ribosomal protein L21 [Alphaproteobacteria bacterium]